MSSKIKLVCPACSTINQFDSGKPAASAKCGKCGEKLITGAPIDVDHAALRRHIQHSELPILVDFWAPWCGPCRAFAPTYQSYAKNQAAKVLCLKLNTEDHHQAGMEFHIRSIPTLALFRNKLEIERVSGALNEAQLAQWVAQNSGA